MWSFKWTYCFSYSFLQCMLRTLCNDVCVCSHLWKKSTWGRFCSREMSDLGLHPKVNQHCIKFVRSTYIKWRSERSTVAGGRRPYGRMSWEVKLSTLQDILTTRKSNWSLSRKQPVTLITGNGEFQLAYIDLLDFDFLTS